MDKNSLFVLQRVAPHLKEDILKRCSLFRQRSHFSLTGFVLTKYVPSHKKTCILWCVSYRDGKRPLNLQCMSTSHCCSLTGLLLDCRIVLNGSSLFKPHMPSNRFSQDISQILDWIIRSISHCIFSFMVLRNS